MYAKDLIGLKNKVLVENICQKGVLEVNETILLDDLLNLFIKNKKHLALVRDDYDGLSGLVTLEDILEEIVRREIIDETDRVSDMQKLAKKGVKKHDN